MNNGIIHALLSFGAMTSRCLKTELFSNNIFPAGKVLNVSQNPEIMYLKFYLQGFFVVNYEN